MPYNQSGVFHPLITFQDNTPATAEDQNTQDADIAGGLTQAMTRAGLAPATANISFGGFQAKNIGSAADPGDAINLGFLRTYTFSQAQIIASLTYTPANKAGDTFTGAVGFSSGITIATAGIVVTAGNLTLTSGNQTITSGNLTLSNGTLSVSGGAATFNNGATFAAGLTVSSGTAAIGAATATTATVGDNSTNVATTAFVTTAVNNVLTVAALSLGAYAGASQGVGVSGTAIGATVTGSTLTSYPSASATGGTTLTGIWEFMGRSGAGDGNSGNLWRRDS